MFPRSKRPPSAKEISARFGFPAPPRFVELLQFIHAETGEIADGHDSYFQSITGMYLCGDNMRYDQTPPELFPFAQPGVDGIHFGFIIHDPKLGPEFPVGYLCPMESDGVKAAGRDTTSAFELFLSQRLQEDIGKPAAARISRAAGVLGISPSAAKAAQESGWGFGLPSDELPPVVVKAPAGWRRIPTADGLGVLAPADAFRPSRREEGPRRGTGDWEARAETCLKSGAPGSALVVLRNAVWGDHASPADAASLLQRAYQHLGRPLLAEIVRQQGARQR